MDTSSLVADGYTHEFHPYPAKFPPNVARLMVQQHSRAGGTVLDPFCGSGTTIVEARLNGRNAIGIELNPIGAMITRAKATGYPQSDQEWLANFLARFDARKWKSLEEDLRLPLPDFPNRGHWFDDAVARELATVLYVIKRESPSERLQLLLKTAFSKIIVRVSNQDTETRYARVSKPRTSGMVYDLFLRVLKSYATRLASAQERPEPSTTLKVYEGDIRDRFPQVAATSIDLILTSPPYINSFDYYLYHKQRMHWLESDPRLIRRLEIGNHHRIDTQPYDVAVAEYKDSMNFLVRESARCLSPRGKLVVLIGDGIVKDQVVKADSLMMGLAEEYALKCVGHDSKDLSSVSKTFIKERPRLARKLHHVLVFEK